MDGKEVPWKGNPNADTAAPKKVDDNTYTNTWKKAGKVTMDGEGRRVGGRQDPHRHPDRNEREG